MTVDRRKVLTQFIIITIFFKISVIVVVFIFHLCEFFFLILSIENLKHIN